MTVWLQIRRATREDCRLYWEWANEEAVRAESFSSETIPWDTHVAWFEKRVDAADCRLYAACEPSGEPVGQVRFEMQGGEAVVSVSVGTQHRRRGIALAALSLATERLFGETGAKRITALIRPSNAASLQLFARAGYEQMGKTTVKGQPAVRMVLVREEPAVD